MKMCDSRRRHAGEIGKSFASYEKGSSRCKINDEYISRIKEARDPKEEV